MEVHNCNDDDIEANGIDDNQQPQIPLKQPMIETDKGRNINISRHLFVESFGIVCGKSGFKCFQIFCLGLVTVPAPKPRIPNAEMEEYKNRPYKCHKCNAAFKKPTHIKRHMFTHTGERNFKCELCSK